MDGKGGTCLLTEAARTCHSLVTDGGGGGGVFILFQQLRDKKADADKMKTALHGRVCNI